MHPARVAICTQDLMTWSRLAATVRSSGREPLQVKSPTDLLPLHDNRHIVAVVVDLNSPAGGLAAIQVARDLDPPIPIIAIGPHVDTALLEAARAAGAHHAIAHSQTTHHLARLLDDAAPDAQARPDTGPQAPRTPPPQHRQTSP